MWMAPVTVETFGTVGSLNASQSEGWWQAAGETLASHSKCGITASELPVFHFRHRYRFTFFFFQSMFLIIW